MDTPHVVLHALISLDGRLDGFPADVPLYYEIAGQIAHQAVLTGSGTMLAAADAEGVDMDIDESPAAQEREADPSLPWLVIVDSGGRVRRFAWLRSAPFWRDVVVLVSATTSTEHLARLDRLGVRYERVGTKRVDLRAALVLLAERYGVTDVRVDAGPALNGSLWRGGLVDEVSVVIAPHVVGSAGGRPLRLVDDVASGSSPALDVIALERVRDGHVHVRYAVAASDREG